MALCYEDILNQERIELERQMYQDEIKRETIDRMMEADVNCNNYKTTENYYNILKNLGVL